MKIKNLFITSLLCLGILTGCANNVNEKAVEEKAPVKTSQSEENE